MLFCRLLHYFKINFFETFFQEFHQEYHLSVKQIGSRSGPTFCWAWFGSNLFEKVMSDNTSRQRVKRILSPISRPFAMVGCDSKICHTLVTLMCMQFICLIWFFTSQSTIFHLRQDGSSWVEPVLSLRLMCLAQGHNAVTLVRLEPVTLWSWIRHSTTEPLHSLRFIYIRKRSVTEGRYMRHVLITWNSE